MSKKLSDLEQLMARDLDNVWQTCGCDLLTNLEEMGEEPVMSREDVIDVCVDLYVGGGPNFGNSAAMERSRLFFEMSDAERKPILEAAFDPRFKSWGW